jgi:Tol biopolymer transport system component
VLARTVRASVSTDGGQADGVCEHADISDDGRFVVFESAAANLVPGDTNGVKDVFVRDLVQGKTTRVGVAQGDAESYGAVISGDGSRVAFVSRSTNLVAGDTNGQPDVFLFDRSSGVLTRVSVVPGGAQANGANAEPAIGLRGDVVSWSSEASNLVNNDTNGKADVFVRFFGP